MNTIRLLLVFIFIASFTGCSKKEKAVEKSEGRLLAEQHCTACHQLTEPDLLPKKSWEFTLTYMGFFLGILDYTYLEGESDRTMGIIEAREQFVRDANLLPAEPTLTLDEWRTLRDYFVSKAPEKAIPQPDKPAIVEVENWFSVKSAQIRGKNSITSLVHIDERNGFVVVHDSRDERLTILDRDLDFSDSYDAPGVYLIEAESKGNELFLLNIGDLFASEIGKSYGEVQRAKLRAGIYYDLKILVKDLHRPSVFEFADLDVDGTEELLIGNFGDYTGNFSIYKKDSESGDYSTEPQILSAEPGVVGSGVYDFNEDGRLDIAVLFSAARENLSLFINEGEGRFSRKIIIESHPSFGYTGLELVDFDDDGRMDLLTLNGDNGDSDPYNTLKRDQGIRIYLNKGNLSFEEAYFYPMYGVYGAEVQDFDLDGDLDIAAIAFHPDFYPEKPENFVLLEQSESLSFVPKTHPATYNGRWLTMDSGDFDADGDKDIILGAAYSPVGMIENHSDKFLKLVKEGPPLLVLENRTIR